MRASINIRNFGEFRSTLREYMGHTKRDIRTVLDTKAFYISRGAVRETMSPTREKIRGELMAPISTAKGAVPLAALIINKRRAESGLSGLTGPLMRAAVQALISARIRSRRFIASGWLQTIKDLAPFAERTGSAPARDGSVKQFGTAKGKAYPASTRGESLLAKTVITNSATTNRDLKGALEQYGMPAFLRAWNAEIASMKQYMLDKLQKRANTINTRRH